MKRIVALVVAAAGAAVIGQRWQARQAEQALWAEITDPAPHDHLDSTHRPAPAERSDLVGSH
ncbi:DLW-39 family protein [Mobilicoccus massiliensis]|uniref:DLW-39 family protein n=1 Tax=Mobilicoccus massiliensis TaxID=1522310 RepID=UPI00058CE4C8|nr:DLW-39 family protein [Mobilicoccus massiliensis]